MSNVVFNESKESLFGTEVTVEEPSLNGAFPTIIKCGDDKIDILEWATKYRSEIEDLLLDVGAVLFRGFEIGSMQKFNDLFSNIAGGALEYKNQSSPREKLYENIYTSTSYPKDRIINMHTENSYSHNFIRVIAFYCLKPASKGGETPIADERKLLEYLGEDIINKFREKEILYVRNVVTGAGLDWKTVYQTQDKKVVNERLEKEGIDYQWISDYHLRLKWTLPAIQTHPITKNEMWFNHMYFYHKSLYDPHVLEYFGENNLPFSTYYGDGTNIENSVIQKIKQFYKDHSIVFKWEKDDFLLLDNMMFSHGRNSYEGDRSILTAMAEPLKFDV